MPTSSPRPRQGARLQRRRRRGQPACCSARRSTVSSRSCPKTPGRRRQAGGRVGGRARPALAAHNRCGKSSYALSGSARLAALRAGKRRPQRDAPRLAGHPPASSRISDVKRCTRRGSSSCCGLGAQRLADGRRRRSSCGRRRTHERRAGCVRRAALRGSRGRPSARWRRAGRRRQAGARRNAAASAARAAPGVAPRTGAHLVAFAAAELEHGQRRDERRRSSSLRPISAAKRRPRATMCPSSSACAASSSA